MTNPIKVDCTTLLLASEAPAFHRRHESFEMMCGECVSDLGTRSMSWKYGIAAASKLRSNDEIFEQNANFIL